MSGVIVFYAICAAATYWFYTRKRGGRQIMGALLWPIVLFGAARHGRDQLISSGRRAIRGAQDKGVVQPPGPPPEREVTGTIELHQYGPIDPADE